MATETLQASTDTPMDDGQARHQRYMQLTNHDFPLEMLLASELAQFQTYAIPSISVLLHRTAQYEKDGLKRLDDTRATMFGIVNHPEGSAERETMVNHLNWVHSHYPISNDDNVYTILRMYMNPVEWINRHGWRKLTKEEMDLITAEMVSVGKSMNIAFPSEKLSELIEWQASYRRRAADYHPDNQAVTEGTIEGIKAHFPRWLHPLIPVLVRCLLDDGETLGHLGLNAPTRWQKGLVQTGLNAWRFTSKFYRPWKHRPFQSGWLANYYPSYPEGKLDYCQLGPRKLVQHRNKTAGCPFHGSAK